MAEGLEPSIPPKLTHPFSRRVQLDAPYDNVEGESNKGPFSTRITTPLDIFRFALEGNPVSHTPSSSALREIFDERRITSTDNVKFKIKRLLKGFSVDESTNLRAAGFGVLNEEEIK
jgi:hypothetical protein